MKNLTKQYDGKTVVDSVTFKIPQGKVISMIGPNGAGKSTVLNIISRLIARDSGLVEFEGQDISRWKSKELAKRLAILTQIQQHSDEADGAGAGQAWAVPLFGKPSNQRGSGDDRQGHPVYGAGGV